MKNVFENERAQVLKQRYRKFLLEDVYPVELQLVNTPFNDSLPLLQTLRAKAKQEKLWAPHLAETDGGLGLSLVEFAHVSEILGTTPLGHYIFNCQAPDIGNMELMHQFASPSLKDQYLRPLMNGDIRSCFAMTEPEFAGSNPIQLATTAIREGNQYIINGHKWFTTAADGAAFAIVMAITNPSHESPYQRASMILVPIDTPGFQLVRNISIMGDEGEGYLSHAEIKFVDCRVPIANLIGAEGAGFSLAQARLGPGRIHHCMRWIGICERAFELMCQRAASRKINEKHVLADQQMIQFWIAESRAEINAARLMVLNTAYAMQQQDAKSVKDEIAMIKFFVADVLTKVLDRALQVHGALGMTDDTLLSFWYRHERAARIYDGPDEVHKSSLAKSIVKSYRTV